jgi:hypothetical protein
MPEAPNVVGAFTAYGQFEGMNPAGSGHRRMDASPTATRNIDITITALHHDAQPTLLKPSVSAEANQVIVTRRCPDVFTGDQTWFLHAA